MSMLPKPAPTNIWQRYINVGYTESCVQDEPNKGYGPNVTHAIFCFAFYLAFYLVQASQFIMVND
jgi:hypothetical protein